MSLKTKENILNKIRNGLIQHTTQPFPSVDQNAPLYKTNNEPLDILFAEEFTKIKGNFVYCENKASFAKQITDLINDRKWDNIFCWEFPLQQLLALNSLTARNHQHKTLAAKMQKEISSEEGLAFWISLN